MDAPLKISEIAKILHDYFLSPEEKELNSIHNLTIEINRVLVETGDLTESALGKIETKQGAKNGICGELRENDTERFWVPLYPEKARRYVEQVVLDHFDSIVKQPAEDADAPADPTAEKKEKKRKLRSVWKQLKDRYGDQYQIIILEDPSGYWSFDEEAVLMATICGVTLREETSTHNLIHNKSSHAVVLRALGNAGITHLVVPSEGKEKKPEDKSKGIQENVKFTLKDAGGTMLKCIIQEFEGNVKSVEHVDGTEHIFLKPVTEFEDCLSLSPDAPLARAALGHKKGETFCCNEDRYAVVDVDADAIN